MDTHVRLHQVVTSAAFASINAGASVSEYFIEQVNHQLSCTQDYMAATNTAFYDLFSVKKAVQGTNREIANLVEKIIRNGDAKSAKVLASQILESILASFSNQRAHAEECKLIPTSFSMADETKANYVSKSIFSRLPGYAVLTFEPNTLVIANSDVSMDQGTWAIPIGITVMVKEFMKKFYEISSEPVLGNSRYGILPFNLFFPEKPVKDGPEYLKEFENIAANVQDLMNWQYALDNPPEVIYDEEMKPINAIENIDPNEGFATTMSFITQGITDFFAHLINDYNPYLSATYGVK